MRKIPCTLAMAGMLLTSSPGIPLFAADETGTYLIVAEDFSFPEEIIRLRIQMMGSPVSPVYDKDVEAYLRSYLTYGAKDTEKMLGRAAQVFPVFERYLTAYELPLQLKFLPIVESSLVTESVSTRGAAGLWQFMPATARHLNLVVDQHIDERKDLYKATDAAARYLQKLFKRFGNWDLVLAAYNCGPTRVQQAINQTGSKNFEKIKNLLPLQTQRYLARFLAASYVATYFETHGLAPLLADGPYFDLMTLRIYENISIKQVAKITGLDAAYLRKLNPAYKRDFLPANKNGTFMTMPKASWYVYLEAVYKGKNAPQA